MNEFLFVGPPYIYADTYLLSCSYYIKCILRCRWKFFGNDANDDKTTVTI